VPKDLSVVLLLDYYGALLPEKQRDLVEYYYCDDLSLAEIADNEDITRQGARDSIVRAVNKLREFEAALRFVEKSERSKALLKNYKETLADEDLEKLIQYIDEM